MKKGSEKPSDPNKTLHIYTRVSTSAQANDGTSLKTQHQLGQKKAKELKFTDRLWNDGGMSSNHEDMADRPKLLALFEAIKRGEVKHLWVYDQSRISRKDNVASIFRYECMKGGVTLYTKDGQFDLANPQDRFMKVILDGMGEFENSIRAERTRLGKLNRVREGFWFGGPAPFGYKIVDKKLVPEKSEAVWVRKIFTETIKGTTTLGIKRLLDSKGVLPRRKKGTWSIGSIQALIKNTHYKGSYEHHDKKSDEIIKIDCPAIVDEKTWMAVQQLKARKTSRVSQQNRTTHFYLLRDFMVCGHCGLKMAGRTNKSKNEHHYYCRHKERKWVTEGGSKTPWKRGESCGLDRSLNVPETDELVWNSVKEVHKNSSILREEVKWKILEENQAPLRHTESDLKVLERQLKHLQKMQKQSVDAEANLLHGFATGEIKKGVYDLAVKRVADDLHNLEVKIANLELQIKGGTENRKWIDWMKIYSKKLDNLNDLTDVERREYLKGLVESIVVNYDRENNQHQLTIHFCHPIVGDGIKWTDPENRKLGYKVKNGRKIKTITFKKKAGRGVKLITPVRNQSVTVE